MFRSGDRVLVRLSAGETGGCTGRVVNPHPEDEGHVEVALERPIPEQLMVFEDVRSGSCLYRAENLEAIDEDALPHRDFVSDPDGGSAGQLESAIAGMLGPLGITGIQFADEDGTVTRSISFPAAPATPLVPDEESVRPVGDLWEALDARGGSLGLYGTREIALTVARSARGR